MASFPFVGNLLWLDFVNTEPVRDGGRVDLLRGYEDLAGWLRQARALSEAGERQALARWAGRPAGQAVLAQARELRSALRAGAERLAGGREPGRPMVNAVNRVLATRPAYSQLVAQGGTFRTRLEPVRPSVSHLLVPVAESAAWLLEHGDPALLRQCGGEDCVLFFYDTTKNHSRRWCSMDGCGGRAKAGAYYRRRHSAS